MYFPLLHLSRFSHNGTFPHLRLFGLYIESTCFLCLRIFCYRSQYHQNKGKYKHKKSQHKHGGDSSRKQYHSASLQSGSSSLELEQTTGIITYGECMNVF